MNATDSLCISLHIDSLIKAISFAQTRHSVEAIRKEFYGELKILNKLASECHVIH